MNDYKFMNTIVPIVIILGFVIYFMIDSRTIKKDNISYDNINVGDVFLYSNNWEKVRNPFNEIVPDTIKIIGKKGGYLKYERSFKQFVIIDREKNIGGEKLFMNIESDKADNIIIKIKK